MAELVIPLELPLDAHQDVLRSALALWNEEYSEAGRLEFNWQHEATGGKLWRLCALVRFEVAGEEYYWADIFRRAEWANLQTQVGIWLPHAFAIVSQQKSKLSKLQVN